MPLVHVPATMADEAVTAGGRRSIGAGAGGMDSLKGRSKRSEHGNSTVSPGASPSSPGRTIVPLRLIMILPGRKNNDPASKPPPAAASPAGAPSGSCVGGGREGGVPESSRGM